MFRIALVAVAAASSVLAQADGPVPTLNPDPTDTNNLRLIGKAFPFDAIPFKADTTNGVRGPQSGFNLCNSTTQGQQSLCQTLVVNSLEDFCIYAPPTFKKVDDAEEEVVAWCTQPTHGARLIPAGTITGAQFIKTPSYIEVTGLIKQSLINIPDGTTGGELDSGGQDLRGNPIGGLAYSNNMPHSSGQMTQSRMWHEFIGSNTFCLKLCDNEAPNASGLCRHRLDTIGCLTAVPASYQDGVFLSCEGDDQAPVAVGVTDIPKSSNCQTFTSSALWTNLPSGTSTSSTSTSTPTGHSSLPNGSGSPSGSNTASGSTPSTTDGTGAASTVRASSFFAAVAGVVGAAVFA
ncbi:hypothetical protein EXIGLDRAFT_683698 [Exidia glandulosa HHB12029]|uniref:Macrofage activating glyco protein n=1 Tax=Exidia glandulosa HHB12029 TaxID=1314781 RepID=A0A165CZM8_EXIGL|nr:hypothetical protein EXIGLDRAFT_683698 [Exidia glandulosa HHB12029]